VTAGKLSVSFLVIAVVLYFALGALIGYIADSMTPQQEVKLEKILSYDDNISDTKSPYLRNIMSRLTKCADLPYPIHIKVLPKKQINAFAAPGGIVYVTKGLLKKIKSENTLAFVLGHELGHFKHKDHLRGLGYKLIYGAAGILLGNNYGNILGITLAVSSAKHSQEQELAADAYGLEVMQCAYGTVNGADDLFEQMKDGKEWKYFTADHPAFEERLTKMRELIKKKGYNTKGKILPLGKWK